MPTQDITWIVPEGGGGREFDFRFSSESSFLTMTTFSSHSQVRMYLVSVFLLNDGKKRDEGAKKEKRRRRGAVLCFSRRLHIVPLFYSAFLPPMLTLTE